MFMSLQSSYVANPNANVMVCQCDGIKSWALWGHLVAELVKRLTSAQVMTLQFLSSSPMSGSVLTAQRLEPASASVSPSLCALPHLCSVSQK